MISDFIEDMQTRILQHFPERQIFLRSGGEVKYYLFSTRLQLTIVSIVSAMALWCVYTLFSFAIGYNPLSASGQKFKAQQARFERQLADARAKEVKAQLLLAEQRTNFEEIARGLEQKHQALSQVIDGTEPNPEIEASQKYVDNRILMHPISRDFTARKARRSIHENKQLLTGLDIDNSLNSIADTQNQRLALAESDALSRIDRNRALIKHTNMNVKTILEEGSYGKGGAYLPIDETILDNNGFVPRVTSVQARYAEAERLDNAVRSLPLGQPIPADSYRTSGFGLRRDPFTKRPTQHQGIDFGGRRDTPIMATADGVVTYVGRNGAYGRTIEIDHGHGFTTRYAHLYKTYVKRGQTVKSGEKIAGMGSTGRSTATHLHYEVHFQGRQYDPDQFLKAGLYVQ